MPLTWERSKLAVPDEVLQDLRHRLDRTRLPNSVAGIGWEQGAELGYVEELLAYWRNDYDWRRAEARLNRFEQLVTTVDGQPIHVLHARSAAPDALALLLTHGWPGSVMEFLDVLEPLSEHFHVVAPSLPGFTFSGPTAQRGWHPRRIGVAWVEIMESLGYARYGLQGGDWGASVSTHVADLVPERIAGLHLNFVTARPPAEPVQLSAADERSLADTREWRRTGAGYQEIQATKPQSLGYGLQDSPAGLAGWIVEKFREWSDADIRQAFSFDRLLDNITAYWVTGTAASSLRIYWETRQAPPEATVQRPITVPTAIAEFPGEIFYPPRPWVEAAYNVVRWTNPARGGHFAAMEAPQEFIADVGSFFRDMSP